MRRLAWLVCLTAALGLACSGETPAPNTPAKAAPARAGARQRPAARAAETMDLPANEVVRAMRTNEKRLRMCFFQAPLASGFVRVVWDADSAGVVERVKVKQSTIDDSHVEKCLTERVEELRFGELGQAARGEWTFVFRLVKPDEEPKRDRKERKAKAKDSASSKPGVILETTSPGHIDMSKVDEVVQFSYPLFARCYRDAIARDSGLAGWVGLRVIIDKTGRVSRVLDGESDLEDPIALDCIAESFYALKFPKPRGGNAHVLYRMRLN